MGGGGGFSRERSGVARREIRLTPCNLVHLINSRLWDRLIIQTLEEDIQSSFRIIHDPLNWGLFISLEVLKKRKKEETYRMVHLLDTTELGGQDIIDRLGRCGDMSPISLCYQSALHSY